MQRESSTFEAKILDTLDRCLLKMSGILDSRFDPNNQDSLKLLKLFRSTMSIRRTWAKAYDLGISPVPRGTGTNSHPSQTTSKSVSSPRSSASPVISSPLEKVIQTLSRPIAETSAVKNGLLL